MKSGFTTTTFSLSEFIESINEHITTDPLYERPEGCWTKSNINGFISAQSRGQASSPIVVADVISMKDYADAPKTNNPTDSNYFASLLSNGHRSTSIDGKHRRDHLRLFLENKISFTGFLYDLEGRKQFFKNKLFKDLPKDFKTAFENTQIVLTTYRNCSREDCSEIARNLNSGSPFSAHQLRNTYPTEISQITNGLTKAYDHVIKEMYTDKQISRMQPEETLAKIHMHLVKPERSLSKRDMDEYYIAGSSKGNDYYDGNATYTLLRVLEEANTIYSYNKESLRRADQFVFMLLMEVINSEYEIHDYESFLQKASEVDERLKRDTKIEFGLAVQANPELKESRYYYEQARLNWGINRSSRFKTLLANLRSDHPEIFAPQECIISASDLA